MNPAVDPSVESLSCPNCQVVYTLPLYKMCLKGHCDSPTTQVKRSPFHYLKTMVPCIQTKCETNFSFYRSHQPRGLCLPDDVSFVDNKAISV